LLMKIEEKRDAKVVLADPAVDSPSA